MALITKIGGRESNSFVSIDEAEARLSELYEDISGWEDLEDAQKEQRLMLAAETVAMLPLRGLRVFCGQALCFPRTVQHNVHSYPQIIKDVQSELAYTLIHRAMQAQPAVEGGADTGMKVTHVSLGGLLSVSFKGDPVNSGTLLDQITRSLQFASNVALRRYITQIRGRQTLPDESVYVCLTTTTTTTTTTV